ncbi:hypothetical protein, partial [Pseudomonas sp. BF-R-12]|uniref:hypothetical protein n=1 Tax=Pseudomonas sp. BF-R-12 TaxID=2832363 RepID=UPI001CBB8771
LKCDALIQTAHVIVNDHRQQAGSYRLLSCLSFPEPYEEAKKTARYRNSGPFLFNHPFLDR